MVMHYRWALAQGLESRFRAAPKEQSRSVTPVWPALTHS